MCSFLPDIPVATALITGAPVGCASGIFKGRTLG